MSLTRRFAFHALDGTSTADDRDAFARLDPGTVDALLAAMEVHNHTGGNRLTDPQQAPTYVVHPTGGTLPSGSSFGYCISFLDGFGLESAASPIATAATPASLAAPNAAGVEAAAGGTLVAGLYHYALSTKAGSDITPLGPVVLISLDPTEHSAVLTLPALPAGGDSLIVWRQGPLDSAWTNIGTGAGGATFTDDGSVPTDPCPTDLTRQPPITNVTRSIASIEVHTAEAFPVGTVRWRVYRSNSDGSYTGDNLAAEIGPAADGTLPTAFLDTGAALSEGAPSSVSRTLTPSVVIPTLVVTALPTDLTGIQDGVLAILVDPAGANPPELHAVVARAWAPLAGGGTATATVVLLTSPAGTCYQLLVDDDGGLSTTPVGGPVTALIPDSPNPGELSISWTPPTAGEPTEYHVHYLDPTNAVGGAQIIPAGTYTAGWIGLPSGPDYVISITAVFPGGSYEAHTGQVSVMEPDAGPGVS